jgi:hypothetical protein
MMISIDITLNQPYERYAMMMILILSPNGLAVEISICEDEMFQKNINKKLRGNYFDTSITKLDISQHN